MLQVVPAAGDLRSLWLVAVLRARELTLGQRAVLGILAHFADWSTGRNAYPSRALLAQASGQSDSNVKRALSAGREAGYIEATSEGGIRGGRGVATVYRLTLPVSVVADVRASVRSDDDRKGSESAPVSDEQKGGQSAPVSDERGASEHERGASQHQNRSQPAPPPSPTYQVPGGRAGARASRDAGGPDPLQESSTGNETSASAADASSAPAVRPADRCQRHIGVGWVEERCRDCARAKETARQWDAGADERRAAAYRAKLDAIAECTRCDEYGQIDHGDSVAKCTHPEVVAA